MNTITGFGKEKRYLGQYQLLSATEIILWPQGQYRPSVNLTPYLHASQLEIVQLYRTPRELFLVAATKPGYTFLSICIDELEAVSFPSFGSAPVCMVEVLFVPVDEGCRNGRASLLFRHRTASGKVGTHVSLVY